MKKLLLLLLVAFALNFNAQIALEHTYTVNGSNNYPKTYAFFTDAGLNYYSFNSDTNQVVFYNENHVSFKTVNLNLGDYKVKHIYLVTDKLFNLDSNIEFIASTQNSNFEVRMILCDEDGNVINELGDKWEAHVIKVSENTFKLITATDKEIINSYSVYSLPGTLSNIHLSLLNSAFSLYPNPAQNEINIITDLIGNEELVIYNINGQMIQKSSVNFKDNTAKINIENLSSGQYILKIGTKSFKFLKE